MKNKEADTTYPYPTRPSVLVDQEGYSESIRNLGIEAINLSKEERDNLLKFETTWFRKYKKANGVPGVLNTLYPQSFTSEEGSRLYSLAYLDEGLKKRFKEIARKNGVDIKRDPAVRTRYWNAVFDDLLEIAKDKQKFDAYCGEGVNFPHLQKAVKGDKQIVVKGRPARLGDNDISVDFDVVVQVTLGLNLSKVPPRIRTRMNNYSSDVSKEVLKQKILSGTEVENPKRLHFVVNPSVYKKKLGGLRALKAEIKSNISGLQEESDNLSKAKTEVLNLYRQRLNVSLASEYALVNAMSSKSTLNNDEKELLGMIKVKEGTNDSLRASRIVSRIDRFLRGVGLEYVHGGMLVVIPQKLADHASDIAERSKSESGDYSKYNSVILNDEQMRRLTQVIINSSGNEESKKWKAETLPKKRRWTIKYKSNGKFIRQIVIPKGDSRGLIDTLAVVSHEFEGHAIQRQNKQNLGKSLHLIEELTTGRSSIMSKCGAMAVEAKTYSETVGQDRSAEPYYYLAIKRKSEGGTFVNCLETFMESYSQRKFGLSYKELLKDEEKFSTCYEYSHPRVLSIFRRRTPLNDKTGQITDTSNLEYVEQELLVEALTAMGLEKLMYLSGVDLYSVESLIKLGMLKLDNLLTPEYITVKVVWPKIKKAIDKGGNINAILNKMEEELKNKEKRE